MRNDTDGASSGATLQRPDAPESISGTTPDDSTSIERFTRAQETALTRFGHVDDLGDACTKEVGGKEVSCELSSTKI